MKKETKAEKREAKKLLGEQKILLITLLSLLENFLSRKESIDMLLAFLLDQDAILSSHAGSILSSQSQDLKKNKEAQHKIFASVVDCMKKNKNSAHNAAFCLFLERLSGKKIGNSPDLWIQWWEKEGIFLFP